MPTSVEELGIPLELAEQAVKGNNWVTPQFLSAEDDTVLGYSSTI